MGTQQLLMILLSVIIVGAAVAVAIQMFDTQSHNLTRSAMMADAMHVAVQAQAWYRTPSNMGGGRGLGTIDNTNMEAIAKYINRNADMPAGTDAKPTITNEGVAHYMFDGLANGVLTLHVQDVADDNEASIYLIVTVHLDGKDDTTKPAMQNGILIEEVNDFN